MITRGKWRRFWALLTKHRNEFTRMERLKIRAELISMIPFCVLYWTLFTVSEGFEAVSEWVTDAGSWIHDRVWRDDP